MNLVKDNRGISQFVSAVVVVFVLIAVYIAITTGLKLHNEYTMLNDFALKLAEQAGNIGKCQGAEIDKRYDELSEVTGLSPTVKFEADYFNSTTKKVQYGDMIKVTVYWETELLNFNGFSIPISLIRSADTNSEQYWK